MSNILDFTRGQPQLPPTHLGNLKLMLWAGDGYNHGLSDVARLPGYDVYLCMNMGDGVQRNLPDLREGQLICIVNVRDPQQMNEFCFAFRAAFAEIDSDYYGNTPSLPLTDYLTLLVPGGVAHNIWGLNGLHSPIEDMLNRLELLAPILESEDAKKRMWSESILSLARRDDIPPSFVWNSPDLKHPFYNYQRQEQERFVNWQKERNPRWPMRGPTLEEHWKGLPLRTLLVNPLRNSFPTDTSATLMEPHVAAFDAFLSEKIEGLKGGKIILKESHESRAILTKQQILRDMSIGVPEGLTGVIETRLDSRYPEQRAAFGLSLHRDI